MTLIAAGADIHAKDNIGKTVLMYAVENSNENIVKVIDCSPGPMSMKQTYREWKQTTPGSSYSLNVCR